MVVHLFGPTSSPTSCCSHALRKTADDNQVSFSEKTIETVRKKIDLDDCLNYLLAKEEVVEPIDELSALLARGGFRLTKCHASCERASTVDLDLARLPSERALGVEWKVEDDGFDFEVVRLKRIPEEMSCHLLLQSITPLSWPH